MTFLNPSYLFGLLAIGIPIIIHFLNLKRMKEVEFSSIKFLKEIQKTKIRNIKIKQWLLLLIRVLIIFFIVLIFARPTIKDKFFIAGDSEKKISAVIIIDNSISMTARSNSSTKFQIAKAEGLKYLRSLKDGDEITILSTSMENRKIKLKNIAEAEKGLNEIKISYISKDISIAFKEAVKLLNTSSGFSKELVIFSDFQKSQMFFQVTKASDYELDNRIKLFLINFNKNSLSNISLTNLKLENQIIKKGMNIKYNISLSNCDKEKKIENVVSLFLNNERAAQKGFAIDNQQKVNLILEANLKHSGLIETSAEIEDDEILYDNKLYSSVFVPELIEVIGIAEDQAELQNIKLALNSIENINFRISSVNKIGSMNLNAASLLIISAPNDEKKIEELVRLLPKNKNLFILPSSQISEANMNKFLKLMKSGSATLLQNTSPIKFENIDLKHPIFSELFENKNNKMFESPKVFREFRLKIDEPYKQIISLQNQSLFLVEKLVNDKKYLICSSAFDEKFSDFQFKGIFAPFIVNLIYYLSLDYSVNERIAPGDAISLSLIGTNTDNLKVINPAGESEYLSVKNRKRFIYSNTDQIGTYKFFNDGRLISFVDVNVNPLEFQYDFYSPKDLNDRLKQLGIKNELIFIDQTKSLSNIITLSRVGNELWKILLYFTLLLIIAEMLLAKNTKKDLVKVNV